MGNGLLVTLSQEFPTILNLGDESIEIVLSEKKWDGNPIVWIKASKDVGITGAHLLKKSHLERQKLEIEIKELKKRIATLEGQE